MHGAWCFVSYKACKAYEKSYIFFGTLGFRYILMSAWDVQPKGADMIWDDDMYARVRHDMLLTLSEVKKQ